jgi:hypothetical protein
MEDARRKGVFAIGDGPASSGAMLSFRTETLAVAGKPVMKIQRPIPMAGSADMIERETKWPIPTSGGKQQS